VPLKLEYFPEAFEERGLVLIYGCDVAAVNSLRSAFRALNFDSEGVSIHELAVVEPVNGCMLTAGIAHRGRGIRRTGPQSLHWVLAEPEWEDVDGLLEPFARRDEAVDGVFFQHLNPYPGCEVIFSSARQW